MGKNELLGKPQEIGVRTQRRWWIVVEDKVKILKDLG